MPSESASKHDELRDMLTALLASDSSDLTVRLLRAAYEAEFGDMNSRSVPPKKLLP